MRSPHYHRGQVRIVRALRRAQAAIQELGDGHGAGCACEFCRELAGTRWAVDAATSCLESAIAPLPRRRRRAVAAAH
ncbi:MAG: hypothetical protein K2R98_17535 [Gemmataceae bacterium]|nr:hypothetical protein [Gemmataceae bacterium]